MRRAWCRSILSSDFERNFHGVALSLAACLNTRCRYILKLNGQQDRTVPRGSVCAETNRPAGGGISPLSGRHYDAHQWSARTFSISSFVSNSSWDAPTSTRCIVAASCSWKWCEACCSSSVCQRTTQKLHDVRCFRNLPMEVESVHSSRLNSDCNAVDPLH